MEYFSNTIKWLLIIVILSILGLNIFNYLAKVTDLAARVTGGVAKDVTSAALAGTEQTVKVASVGTKAGVDVATGVITGGIQDLEKVLDVTVEKKGSQSRYTPDESGSDVQMPKKSGYCFIGEESGYRSCVRVGKRDTCMSGEIFPTMDVCINPSLRA